MNTTIQFETKSHYGGPELVYVTSEHKEPLQVLTGPKTLSDRHVKALEELGFKFEAKEKRVALKNRPHHMALANHFRRLATFSDYLDGES